MQGLKALQLFFESQNVTRTCERSGCMETTREGKHFCTNHIEEQPYIKTLLKRMQDRTNEDELVRMEGSSAVNMGGITAKEILLQLRLHGERTEERLMRELKIDKTIIHNYAIRLCKEGIAHFGRTRRDNLTIVPFHVDMENIIEEDDDMDEEE